MTDNDIIEDLRTALALERGCTAMLEAQMERDRASRIHWVNVRKALIKRLIAEKKEALNKSYGTVVPNQVVTVTPNLYPHAIESNPPLCPKCGKYSFSHPRLGIWHVCEF